MNNEIALATSLRLNSGVEAPVTKSLSGVLLPLSLHTSVLESGS